MAGTAILKKFNNSPDKTTYEIIRCSIDGASTTVVVTPTLIDFIEFVTVTPMDAASCADDLPYLTTFVYGDATVTITGAASTEYLVKVEGKIA
jgi:hypothetical protein